MYPPPVVFILGLPIYAFGLVAALSILLGYWMTACQMRRAQLSVTPLPDLALAVMISAFIGARLFFVAFHADDYLKNPLSSLHIWKGGLVLYGGIAGGFAGGLIFCKSKGLPFLKLADAVAVGLCLGLAISRLGCFLSGCCYGTPTSLFWGVSFRDPLSLARPQDIPLHPVQLYFFLAELSIFLFLLVKRKRFDGELILFYFMLASGTRLMLEFFRAQTNVLNSIWVGLFFVLSGFFLLSFNRKNQGGTMKMRASLQLAAISLFAVFFAACGIISTQKMTRGHKIEQSEVDSLVKGTSTEKDVLKLFGPPTKVRDTTDGKEYLYEYAKSGGFKWNLLFSIGGGTETRTLLVWLNQSDVVTDYAFKQS